MEIQKLLHLWIVADRRLEMALLRQLFEVVGSFSEK